MHQRVQHAQDYLNNWSLALDLKIIARTPLTVRQDCNACLISSAFQHCRDRIPATAMAEVV